MSKELLQFLAEEVRKGNRPNNTFRTSSFIAAAKMISEKFQTTCTADHVENHMRTVRTTWGIISQLRGKSGFGWDDKLKMIAVSPNAYDAYVKQYPSHEKYLSKKIDMYEEISIVVGKDMARGNYSKTFGDIQNTSSGQTETEPTKSDSVTSSEPRSHRKRSRAEEGEVDLEHISTQLGEVVSALKKFSDNQLDIEKLYEEIMRMDDVDEAARVAAFDHLVEREMLAKAFLTKSEPLRKRWLHNFVNSLT
ncbi:L10-interacting MYB domain-containing protein [Bienertia sinuspersici]